MDDGHLGELPVQRVGLPPPEGEVSPPLGHHPPRFAERLVKLVDWGISDARHPTARRLERRRIRRVPLRHQWVETWTGHDWVWAPRNRPVRSKRVKCG